MIHRTLHSILRSPIISFIVLFLSIACITGGIGHHKPAVVVVSVVILISATINIVFQK